MRKSISFNVDADVFDKFNMALNLSGETSDEAADSCLRWYIARLSEMYRRNIRRGQQEQSILMKKIFTVRHFNVYQCGR